MAQLGELQGEGKRPFFVAAGVIKTKDQIARFAEIPYVSALVLGSFTDQEWGGNDPSGTKRVAVWDEETQTFFNAVGLKNPGRKEASRYMPEGIKRIQAAGKSAILAVATLKHEDARIVMPDLAEWALDMGADGVELTLSCPNLGQAPVLCLDVEKSLETAVATRQRIGDDQHLQAKVSPLAPHFISKYAASPDFRVNAVSAINTCLRKTYLIEVNDGWAGESGPIVAERARNNLEKWVDYSKGLLQIWSVGGVASGQEVYDRVANLGAAMAGGAQAFYRSEDPAALSRRWAQEFDQVSTNGSS